MCTISLKLGNEGTNTHHLERACIQTQERRQHIYLHLPESILASRFLFTLAGQHCGSAGSLSIQSWMSLLHPCFSLSFPFPATLSTNATPYLIGKPIIILVRM
ncbi:unnamed protein product [Pipistrellus nathusii]|uniref:Uncharacterized protein n=1 Tax=Pipistrellus nathusii TaxID=59473 RepID=A0ABN9ZXT7_PIPNA